MVASCFRLLLPLALLGVVACSADAEQRDAPVELPDAPAPRDIELRGFYVVNSGREGSKVSLLDPGGQTPSAPFDLTLSIDVAVPSSALPEDELVLLDRSFSSLTWLSLETMSERARLRVNRWPGALPIDYVPLSPTKAYVSRFESDHYTISSGVDRGGDVLIIDPSKPSVLGRIDLAPALAGEDESYVPRAARALAIGDRVLLLVTPASPNPSLGLSDSRLVIIDAASDSIEQIIVLDAMKACGQLALSPSGRELAIACGGEYGRIRERGFFDAGILILELGDEIVERQRFAYVDLGDEQIVTLAYASDTSLLFTTQGRYSFDGSELVVGDSLRLLDLARGVSSAEPLLVTRASASSLSDLRCTPRTGTCLLADAETDGGVLHRFEVASDGSVSELGQVAPNPELGLPPRFLGAY